MAVRIALLIVSALTLAVGALLLGYAFVDIPGPANVDGLEDLAQQIWRVGFWLFAAVLFVGGLISVAITAPAMKRPGSLSSEAPPRN